MGRREYKPERGVYEYPKDSEVWWVHFYDASGRRHREKAGTHANAIKLRDKRRGEKLERKKLPENLRTKPVTFDELMDDAVEHSKASNGEDTTYELELKYEVLRPIFGSRPAEEIRKQEIVRWLTEQAAERKWKAATRNRWQAAFSLAFRVGLDNEKIEKSPAARIRRKREDNGRVRFLDNAEEQALVEVLKRDYPQYLPAFIISINTGVRASEQWRVRRADVDIERRMLTVRKTKNGAPERHVSLNSFAVVAFQEILKGRKDRGPVFLNTDGKPLRGHRDWFEPAVKAAKLEDYTWHCNRHTFASRLIMAGVDLRTVAQLMGHKTIQMTMRYAHLAPDHQQNAVERLCEAATAIKTATGTQAAEAAAGKK